MPHLCLGGFRVVQALPKMIAGETETLSITADRTAMQKRCGELHLFGNRQKHTLNAIAHESTSHLVDRVHDVLPGRRSRRLHNHLRPTHLSLHVDRSHRQRQAHTRLVVEHGL